VALESFVTNIEIPPEMDGPNDFHPTIGQKVRRDKSPSIEKIMKSLNRLKRSKFIQAGV